MRTAAPALAALALLLGAAAPRPAAGQDGRDPAPVIQRIAALWAGGDAAGIARQVSGSGFELEVQGDPIGPIASRQAAAALRRIFAGQETIAVTPTLTARVQGAEDRAFGELRWEHRARGAESSERHTVFVGLVREGRGWRVSQIRILP